MGVDEITGLKNHIEEPAFTNNRSPDELYNAWDKTAKLCGINKGAIRFVYSPLDTGSKTIDRQMKHSSLVVQTIGIEADPFGGNFFLPSIKVRNLTSGIVKHPQIFQNLLQGVPYNVWLVTYDSPGFGPGDSGTGYFLGNRLIGAHGGSLPENPYVFFFSLLE